VCSGIGFETIPVQFPENGYSIIEPGVQNDIERNPQQTVPFYCREMLNLSQEYVTIAKALTSLSARCQFL
jgi:hypothetical protein